MELKPQYSQLLLASLLYAWALDFPSDQGQGHAVEAGGLAGIHHLDDLVVDHVVVRENHHVIHIRRERMLRPPTSERWEGARASAFPCRWKARCSMPR